LTEILLHESGGNAGNLGTLSGGLGFNLLPQDSTHGIGENCDRQDQQEQKQGI
jgi:hypothetical protein